MDIEQLMSGLKSKGLLEKVNVIITSDHGMTPVIKNVDISNIIPKNSLFHSKLFYPAPYDNRVKSEEIGKISKNVSSSMFPSDIQTVEFGPILSLFIENGTNERKLEILENLKKEVTGSARVYLKENIPRRFRYSFHRRIPDIVAIANEGVILV